MVADANARIESDRLTAIETRVETFLTREQHERDNSDIKVMLAEIRSEIRNLKWQLAVIVSILSATISFLVSRIPL